MSLIGWSAGDWAIYRKPKRSTAPGPRARNVMPATGGESYSYTVDKYWVVRDVLEGQRLRLQTRRGKRHEVSVDDPALRKPHFWECWLWRHRFLAVENSIQSAED
ncbi:hypothetical protein FYK55_25080 [Roseiconus nitratireducens]|uniref:Uncharacterized protein n=1 Tax=Roseiconus nitratireducens TaxID=2605748 RepID=A0A5M6CVB8_9BACT|nr:hypothetical protein [Roseiconus nitratireducens]KAA5539197.1 hypothetical protein FYK55_25080 [Roseiconus nitratireducens]